VRWRLYLLMFLQYAIPGAVLPLYSACLDRLGFDEMELAACCAAQALALLVAPFVAGHAADRWFSAERCLAFCSLLAGLDLWVLADLTGFAAIFTATFLFWLLSGPIVMLGTAICFSHLSHPDREFGRVRLWGTVGWMSACWLLGYWFSNPPWLCRLVGCLRPVAHSEWPDLFRLGSLLAFTLAGFTLLLPHTPPRPGRHGGMAPLAALSRLRGGSFAVYSACTLGVCITIPFATQGMPLMLQKLGVGQALLPQTLTLPQVTEIISLALLPLLLLRLGLRGTMLLGLGALTAELALLALGRPLELMVGSTSLHGLCISGFLVAGQVFLNQEAVGDLRASVQSLYTFLTGAGMLVGNLLVGWLRRCAHGELPLAYTVGAGLTAGLLLLFLLGFRERRTASHAA
jgi:hypothetical protein